MTLIRKIITFICDILRGLGSASSFSKDWYGYLTNQFSHVGVGIFAAWLVCLAAFLISGDLPYRWQVFVGIAVVYGVKELIVDTWKGRDTIEDFLFVVVYGAGGTLNSFRQIDAFSSNVVFNIFDALPFLAVCITHLFLGVALRWRAASYE